MDPVKTEMRQEAISFDQVAYLSKITWSNYENEGNNVNKITVNKVFQKYFLKNNKQHELKCGFARTKVEKSLQKERMIDCAKWF